MSKTVLDVRFGRELGELAYDPRRNAIGLDPAEQIADLVLAGIIIYGWPVTWALGVLAGVNLITSGLAMCIEAERDRYGEIQEPAGHSY